MMSDKETAEFVHTALFRQPPPRQETLDASLGEYLADALYDAASRAQYHGVPQPMGNPSSSWLYSHEVKSWLAENDKTLTHDLAMYVSSAYHPVTEAKKPAKRGR